MDKNLIKEFELAEKLMSEKQYEESIRAEADNQEPPWTEKYK